jgi:hypothetical protein
MSASALATGGTTARTLAAIFADQNNVKSFGAVGDGTTVDLAALNAAAVGGPAYLPAGSYVTGTSVFTAPATSQRFRSDGLGQVYSSDAGGRANGPNLALIVSPPTPATSGNFGGADPRFIHLAAQTYLFANALPKPTSGYYSSLMTAPINIAVTNLSGWQEQVLGSGRTGAFGLTMSLNQSGRGDLIGLNISGTVSGQNAIVANGPLGLPTLGVLNGTLQGSASNVYIDLLEFNIVDNSHDIQVSGGTYNLNRSNTTGANRMGWWGHRFFSQGATVDAAEHAGGAFRIGYDFSTASFVDYDGTTPTRAAITMATGQGIFGNALNRSGNGLPRQTALGNEMIGWREHYGWAFTAGSTSTVILSASAAGARATNLGTSGSLGSNAMAAGITLQTRDGVVAKTAVVSTIAPVGTGGAYGSKPSIVIAVPSGSGTAATGSVATMALSPQARISASGAGYVIGDVLTLSGGTFTTAAQITITATDQVTGALAAFSVSTPGSYSVLPANAIALTGGTGSGATLTGFWAIAAVTVATGGSNYPEYPPPEVTTSGGSPIDLQTAAFSVTMTATQQTLVLNSGGATQVAGNLVRSAATADQSADVYVATAAGSRTIPDGCSWECLTPAATIATFTTTMPAAPIDKQEVWISTTQTITTWTLSPNTGQTINGAPTTLAENTSVMFRYNLATTTWFRML